MAEPNPVLDTIRNLPLTFYSRDFYASYVRAGRGIGLGFILAVTFFAFAVTAVALRGPARLSVTQLQSVLAQMPDATIKGHKLSIDKPAPFTIKVFDTKNSDMPNNLVIDTGYALAGNDTTLAYMKQHDAVFLVTADKFVSRTRTGLQIDDLSSLPEGHYTHDDWQSLSAASVVWMYPAFLAIAGIGIVAGNVILAIFGGIAALLLGLVADLKLDFPSGLRLAAAAAVPASVVVLALGLSLGIKILIWLGFAIFGLIAVKKASVTAA